MLTVRLPSLIQKIGRERVREMRRIALGYQCELKRIRRSRHWQICGQCLDLKKLAKDSFFFDGESAFHIRNTLISATQQHQESIEPLERRLLSLIRIRPDITLSELMERTDCSIQEARKARFLAESDE